MKKVLVFLMMAIMACSMLLTGCGVSGVLLLLHLALCAYLRTGVSGDHGQSLCALAGQQGDVDTPSESGAGVQPPRIAHGHGRGVVYRAAPPVV